MRSLLCCALLIGAHTAAHALPTATGTATPTQVKSPRGDFTGKRAILNDERFGRVLRPRFFLRESLTQFNHGSFGTVPRDVMTVLHQYQEQCEAFPDDWIQTERGYRPLLESARGVVSEYVGAESDDLVFVENASDGCNSFIRSLQLRAGDKVLYLSSAYGMVKQILFLLEQVYDVELVECDVTPSGFASPALILEQVALTVEAHGGAEAFALGLICHIASLPGVILPIEGFISMLPGVPVFIDGAHAPGVITLDMGALRTHHLNVTRTAAKLPARAAAGAVGYVGNMHKWMFTPKGTAWMWVSPELQSLMVPSVLSGCLGQFQCEYEYTGTRDYAAFTTVPAGFAFRASIATDDEVMAYGHELALWTGEYLSRTWETQVMEAPEMTGWMTNVKWPTEDAAAAQTVSARLFEEYDIKLNVFTMGGIAGVWSRISLVIYLEVADVENIGELVPQLLAEERRKHRGKGAAPLHVNVSSLATRKAGACSVPGPRRRPKRTP